MNTDSREMLDLIRLRGETPVLWAADDECQLWRFADGTEVIVTNAGVVAEDDEGFAETRAAVVGGATTYEVRDHAYSEEFTAPDDDAAIAYARRWLEGGDWPRDETQYLTASVYRMPENDCVGEATLTLQPLPPACVGGHDHDWCSPHRVVGGMRENPGVFGSGGGVKIVEVCRHCGKRQHTDTWATNPNTGEQGVERVWYTDPDETSLAWVDAQTEACDD